MATPMHWKADLGDLRSRAELVVRAGVESPAISARAAAKCLMGICSLVSRRFSVETMQRTCALLARDDRAWASGLAVLPFTNGRVAEATQLIACVAHGLIPLAGADGVRAALSFWAVEDNPAVWQDVAA